MQVLLLRNSKVKLMWVGGGWYERIAVTVRVLFRSCLSRPSQYYLKHWGYLNKHCVCNL